MKYQDVVQVAEAYAQAVNSQDGGKALAKVLGVPVAYNPDAVMEFTIDGSEVADDDTVKMVLLDKMSGKPSEEWIPELIRESFSRHDGDAVKVMSFLFGRDDITFQPDGELVSGINGPRGTVEDVIGFIYS